MFVEWYRANNTSIRLYLLQFGKILLTDISINYQMNAIST